MNAERVFVEPALCNIQNELIFGKASPAAGVKWGRKARRGPRVRGHSPPIPFDHMSALQFDWAEEFLFWQSRRSIFARFCKF